MRTDGLSYSFGNQIFYGIAEGSKKMTMGNFTVLFLCRAHISIFWA
jgi:hypothetical protein